MTYEFDEEEAEILHVALVAYQATLGSAAHTKANAVAKLLKSLKIDNFQRPPKAAKDKVNAAAVPAVDWAEAEPAKKASAIPMPGGQVFEKREKAD